MTTIKRVARKTRVEIREVVELNNNSHSNKIKNRKISSNSHKLNNLNSNQSNNNSRKTTRKVSEIRKEEEIRTMVKLSDVMSAVKHFLVETK